MIKQSIEQEPRRLTTGHDVLLQIRREEDKPHDLSPIGIRLNRSGEIVERAVSAAPAKLRRDLVSESQRADQRWVAASDTRVGHAREDPVPPAPLLSTDIKS